MKTFVLLLALCKYVNSSHASVVGVQKPKINLSYHTHLNLDSFSSALQQEISRILSETATIKELDKIHVDVSSSIIGDEGLLAVLNTLMSTQDYKTTIKGNPVELDARMNRISSSGVASFLGKYILYMGDSGYKSVEKDDEDDIYKPDTKLGTKHPFYFDSLDFGVNDIGLHGVDHDKKSKLAIVEMNKMIRGLIQNEFHCCPRTLRLDVCGLGPSTCRAIGKGLIDRKNVWPTSDHSLRSLYLSGNEGIGDGGVAAIAAALKIANRPKYTGDTESSLCILDNLDISACHVGDIGAKVLAIALEHNPGCLKSLDLSNNFISDEGAVSLAAGLMAGHKKQHQIQLDSLDLSNNVDIGEKGAEALFSVVQCGAVRRLALRSCAIKWKGAAALGSAIATIITNPNLPDGIEIDLSGNKLGTKDWKKKTNYADGVKKMTNMGMNWLKSSLKDAGFVGDVESDDEEELLDPRLVDEENRSSKCGACAMYDGLDKALDDSHALSVESSLTLALRMCNFEDKGIDALSAVALRVYQVNGRKIHIDCSMNQIVDNEAIVDHLLQGNVKNAALLERANRHTEARKLALAREERKRAENQLNHVFEEETDHSYEAYDSLDEYQYE